MIPYPCNSPPANASSTCKEAGDNGRNRSMLSFILGLGYIGIRVWGQACPPAKRQAALEHCSPLVPALFSPAPRGGAECRLMRRESSQECLWQESPRSPLAFPSPPPHLHHTPLPHPPTPPLAPSPAPSPP